MELCDCSVLNMLERVEYYFGFQEEEFLGILKDISKYLLCMVTFQVYFRRTMWPLNTFMQKLHYSL